MTAQVVAVGFMDARADQLDRLVEALADKHGAVICHGVFYDAARGTFSWEMCGTPKVSHDLACELSELEGAVSIIRGADTFKLTIG